MLDRISEVRKVRAQIYATLAAYERTLDAGDLAEAAGLRRNLDAYFASVEPPLRWTLSERERKTGSYLREHLLPKRGEVVALVRQITEQDQSEIENSEEDLQDAYHAFERGMILAFALTFVEGTIAAILSIRRNSRKVSRELHDQLGQTMSAMVTELLMPGRIPSNCSSIFQGRPVRVSGRVDRAAGAWFRAGRLGLAGPRSGNSVQANAGRN